MSSSLLQTATLHPHPQTPSAAVRRIDVRVARMPDGMLATTYTIKGDIDRVRVPAPALPGTADELWRHTCCEVFITFPNASGYHELNFAPSGEWAIYAFDRYRERSESGDAKNSQRMDPEIILRQTAATLELNALIRLDRLSASHANAGLALGLSAVVEDRDGELSYWALKHPAGRPDFHHRESFALVLDEFRH